MGQCTEFAWVFFYTILLYMNQCEILGSMRDKDCMQGNRKLAMGADVGYSLFKVA